jgi:flagellar biosynthesis protein FlhF
VQLRRFKGKALPEVVAQVRAELGPEAVILHTRESPRGFSRWIHGRYVEVVAALDDHRQAARVAAPLEHAAVTASPRPVWAAGPEPAPAAKPKRAVEVLPAPRSAPAPDVTAFRAWGEPAMPPLPMPAAPPALTTWPVTAAPVPPPSLALEPLKAEIAELRRVLLRFGGARGLPSTMAPVYTWLLNLGVDESLAFRILDEIPAVDTNGPATVEAIAAAVERRVAGMLRVSAAPPTLTRGTIAVVGPTGAGKSTTLAKLAVRAHLEGHAPCVVSLDAMSPAPATPLEAIARMVGITHEVATTPAEVRAALDQPMELKLIDTPGLGRTDEAGIAALAPLLHAARPSEVHFVMPATMKTDDALATLAALGPLWVTRIAFTKLDEASTFGSILGVAAESALPISYVTSGREMPDDIHPASAAELARRVLRRERP